MRGLMMDFPLALATILERAGKLFGKVEILSRRPDRSLARTTGVLHPLNLRLHPREITYIANHAGDRFLVIDDVLLPTYESIQEHVKFEPVWVVPFGGASVPARFESYEALLEPADTFRFTLARHFDKR